METATPPAPAVGHRCLSRFGGGRCARGEGLGLRLCREGRTEGMAGGGRNKSKHELGGFSKPAEGLEKDRL